MPAHCTIDLVGKKIGRLTVLKEAERRGQYTRYFLCLCKCGNKKEIRMSHLNERKILSCGCLRDEKSRTRTKMLHRTGRMNTTTHGLSSHAVNHAWLNMKQRCYNTNGKFYSYYGGRGISVCERWMESFDNFLEDMGMPEKGYTLDRIDTNGNYEPSNCRWATRKEQSNNTRQNRIITHSGKSLTIQQWSEATGIHRNTLDERIKKGWSIKEAIETPVLRRSR